MPHDSNTIHVSHCAGASPWRSIIAPADRSWLLLLDAGGAPHLHLATETREDDVQTVTTYVPCVRAMLAADAATGALPHAIGPITVRLWRLVTGEHVAAIGDEHAVASTRDAAILAALAKIPEAAPAAPTTTPGAFTIAVSPQDDRSFPWIARVAGELDTPGATPLEAVTGALEEVERSARGAGALAL